VQPEPAAINRELWAGAIFGWALPLCSNNEPLINSMKMRPSCTGSMSFAIPMSFLAAASGSANGRGSKKDRKATSLRRYDAMSVNIEFESDGLGGV
jgi:hypothetical protein